MYKSQELGILLQPSLGLFAFVNDVVIEDQRDGFGSSVVVAPGREHTSFVFRPSGVRR